MKEKQKHQTPPSSINVVASVFDESDEYDDVNHPSHYTIGDEVTDFVSSWEMDFHRGNIIKYIVRCPFKNNMIKDLKKAKWYLDDLIKRLEKGDFVI